MLQSTTLHHFTIENNNNIINIITFSLWLVTKLITNFVTRHNQKNLTCAHFQKKILCEICKKKNKQKSCIKNTIIHTKNNNNYYFIKIIVKLACFPWHHSLCILANCCHWLANSFIKCKIDFSWHQLTMHAIFPA